MVEAFGDDMVEAFGDDTSYKVPVIPEEVIGNPDFNNVDPR